MAPKRRRAIVGALAALTVFAAILIGPSIYASGQLTEVGALELGADASPPSATTRGRVREDEFGYRVAPGGEATVTVPLSLPEPRNGTTLLRLWVYGGNDLDTTVVLSAADGSERTLGRATQWIGKSFDVTNEARQGDARLRVTSQNSSSESALFFDRAAPTFAPDSVQVTASRWAVGLLVLLTTATLLALARRLRRHWPLPLLLAGTTCLLWDEIPGTSLEPLSREVAPTWNAALDASWFGFHDGIWWGSWQSLSSLAVQLFHAFTPIVGTAPVSARSASLVAGLLALAAIYAFGYRAAGRRGAVTAVAIAIAAAPFRDACVSGSSLPVLILAAALFGYAVHACLAQATPLAITLLAGGVALLALAEPSWLPGGVLGLVIVAVTCAERTERLRVLGIGVLAILVLLTPHLASTASQNDGSLFADMSARAITARNAEFQGAGHGSPTPAELARDPLSGRPVTLPAYLFRDHSISQVIGGVLDGGQASFAAFADSGLVGVIGFLLTVVGALYVLILPKLRLLLLLAGLVAAPTLFIASRTDADPFASGAPLWPAMLVSTGILTYAVVNLALPLVEPRLPAAGRARSWVQGQRAPQRAGAASTRARESGGQFAAAPGGRGAGDTDR